MTETSEQDRQRDEAGREAIRRLSRPVKGRVMLAQAFTVLSALLSFAPYLAACNAKEPLWQKQSSTLASWHSGAIAARFSFWSRKKPVF